VRYLQTARHTYFLCDDCGKRLVGGDDGTPYWADYDNFLNTVGTDDEEPTLFLCRKCLKGRQEGK
jgi:hypothetical protein